MKNFLPFLSIALSLLLASCAKEPETVLPGNSSFYGILDKYESGATLKRVLKLGSDTILQFADNSEISINEQDFSIENCIHSDPSSTIVDNSFWVVGGKRTGIPFRHNASDRESIPVYSCFTQQYFLLVLSNGRSVFLYCDESFPLKTFTISRRLNDGLTEDIFFSIDSVSVSGRLRGSSDGYNFIPEFTCNAETVLVNGKEQKSGESVQNFAAPVTYSVVRHDGTTVDYIVSLVHEKRFPTIRIKVDDHLPIASKEVYVEGIVTFEDYDHYYSDNDVVISRTKIRGRGNSTWKEPKKPYRLKLDSKLEIFGIHKDKNWALLADYLDKSLLRNQTAMEISRICGMKWTPAMVSAEVYIDGAYKGVYTLSEHKEVSGHKVDIEPAAPGDDTGEGVTGDYYLEIDCEFDGPVNFRTDVGIPLVFSDPEEPDDAQFNYVRNYFKSFESALYASNFTDPDLGYRKYIDVESFINYFIIAELSKNPDGNLRKSSFLTKQKGGKLEFYHVWDFDLAFGNCNYINSTFPGASNGPEGWFIRDYIEKGKSRGWYGQLMEDPEFVAQLKEKWNAVYPQLLAIPDFIDSKRACLGDTPSRNYSVWNTLGVRLWPNIVYYSDYDQEVEYFKSFYSQRLEWMNTAVNSL